MVFRLWLWSRTKSMTTKIHIKRWWFRRPCIYGGAIRGLLPNGAHPQIHAKPLDAAIRQVPAPYCPDSYHGWRLQKEEKTLTKHNLYLLAFSQYTNIKKPSNLKTHQGPSTHVLGTTSPALTLMPLVKLQSSATFWAIKCSKRTKIRKVIKLEQSLLKPVAHIYASSGYPV